MYGLSVAGGLTALGGGVPVGSEIRVTVEAMVIGGVVVVIGTVPLSMMAFSLNMLNDFSTVGLMAKTIPFPQ